MTIQFHYIRELVKEGILSVSHIPTHAQIEQDGLTKPMPSTRFGICEHTHQIEEKILDNRWYGINL